jgi:hypothetical protein
MKTKHEKKCLKATDNKNWWSSVDTDCSPLQNNFISGKNIESFGDIGANYEELAMSTLSDISQIQELEKKKYDKLNYHTLTNDEQNSIMSELLQLSTIKGNLYNTINNLYDTYQNQLGNTTQAVADQMTSIQFVENELIEMSNKTQKLYDENNSKIRLIEINRYYGEKYDNHAGFMKYVIIFTIIYLLVYFLKKKYIINEKVYSILQFIIVFIAIVVMGRYFYKMVFRNNMEYNELQFPIANMLGNNTSSAMSSNINDPWINPNLPTICPTTSTSTSTTSTTSSSTSTSTSPTTSTTSSSTTPTCSLPPTQTTWGNNGSVTCDTYCGGTGGGPWNNELPSSWNGARCISSGGSATQAGCYQTFTYDNSSPANCLCQQTGVGWN